MRIVAIVEVVAIVVVIDVNVVGGIPVIGPVFRPWIDQQERIPAILKARISQIHFRTAAEAEGMAGAEIQAKGVLRNVVTAVATALRPATMVGRPVLSPILLKAVVPLPSTLL